MMDDQTSIGPMMQQIGADACAAATILATAPAQMKADALYAAADAVWDARDTIIAANKNDLAYGADKGLSPAMMDRLLLNPERIQGIVDSLRAVAGQVDPIGQVTEEWTRPSGLHIQRVRTPIGVIGVIYE
ncbi:MAG: glutamate-5-semialdehyde dehydrogenase, partial [Yoonia sp.]